VTMFDYVIVGAGPAGCVLANRPSADPEVEVLLVEAGDDDADPLIAMPMGYAQLLADPATAWHYPCARSDRRSTSSTGCGARPSLGRARSTA
jgi:choline dehydrogenase